MSEVKTPQDTLHGDEHLIDGDDVINVRKDIVAYKVIAVWEDGEEEEVSDELYLQDIDDQLTGLEERREREGYWNE